jgi:hypothetical protein
MNVSIPQEKKLTKKETRQMIYDKLTEAMVEFRPLVASKKFESRLLKITKLFAGDIRKASRKMKMEKVEKRSSKKEATLKG